MTPSERLAFRIAKNREIEGRAAAASLAGNDRFNLAAIVAQLNERKQRATYGAVAGLVGGIARGLMQGQPKCYEYSWVVNAESGWPTDYTTSQIHPDCLNQIERNSGNIIRDAERLRRWLKP